MKNEMLGVNLWEVTEKRVTTFSSGPFVLFDPHKENNISQLGRNEIHSIRQKFIYSPLIMCGEPVWTGKKQRWEKGIPALVQGLANQGVAHGPAALTPLGAC